MKNKELVLSEEQARRLWEKAARLQADAARREKAASGELDSEVPRRQLLTGVEDESSGYSLTHIKQAGQEVGISPDFLELALAEEAILELEGGGATGFWDKNFESFLADSGRVFEIRRHIPLPPRRVWLGIEDALTSETHELELLEVRGGEPDEGGIAIFQSPYSYTKTGSLQYWATAAEMRRFMVQVLPEGEGECEVVVRGPVRRSRRANGVVGMVLSGVGGALGGGLGLGLTGVVAGALSVAAAPVAVGLAAVGVVGGEKLTRFGYIRAYRWAFRSLESAFQRILGRVERDVRRELELLLPPGC